MLFLNKKTHRNSNTDNKLLSSTNNVEIDSNDVLKITFLNSDSLIEGRIISVYDIDLSKDGRLYIPDYRNNKVDIYNKELDFISRIEDIPYSIGATLDNKGFLYVATYRKGRVRKFNSFEAEIVGWDRQIVEKNIIMTPLSVDIDQNNDVYILDYSLKKIIKVNEKGEYLLTFDISKIGGEEKFFPHDIITDGINYVYVADRGEARTIQIFSLDGEYIKSWNIPVADFVPLAVRFLNEKLLLIPNYTDSKLYLFDIYGNFIKTLGKKGKKPAQFLFVTNLIADSDGYVYTVEENSNRIQKINFNKVIDAYGR